jgi:hypothetical protein
LQTSHSTRTNKSPGLGDWSFRKKTKTWIIEGGKLTVKGIVHDGKNSYDAVPVSYKIEEGLFKVALGRPGKFDTYALIERTNDAMVLKDKMGVFYHFKKK